jgi:hypothetical protein
MHKIRFTFQLIGVLGIDHTMDNYVQRTLAAEQ